ncbi:6-carboxytetrahydropterin synthase QueD [Candidatus Peregrinibacteria bacterium]|nr:6-carboxytetrahydropterin synthase QueD [Candidatus Peregrinibacteria bacterium]
MIIGKEFTFDAAHFLKDYHGKCERLHGHTYKLHVCIEGEVEKEGMVFDFAKMKEIVNREVIDVLDHTNINDTLAQSTVENMCIWVWDRLKGELPLCEIRMWESPTSFAIYRG